MYTFNLLVNVRTDYEPSSHNCCTGRLMFLFSRYVLIYVHSYLSKKHVKNECKPINQSSPSPSLLLALCLNRAQSISTYNPAHGVFPSQSPNVGGNEKRLEKKHRLQDCHQTVKIVRVLEGVFSTNQISSRDPYDQSMAGITSLPSSARQ